MTNNDPVSITREIIGETEKFLTDSPWEKDYLVEIERLRQSVDDPCVLAVAGRVKAGKSSLINALLGEDFAKVGVTATTATINSFRYSNQKEGDHSIKCLYKDGREEWVTRQFLNDLQGHEESQLTRSADIRELQFFLDLPILQGITLVDTPGTEADVKEHQQVVEEYLNQTSNADAILYVVGQVPLASDQQFASEFQKEFSMQSTKAINTLGVMTCIDRDDHILNEAKGLAEACADKLKGELSDVVPVSAGVWRFLQMNNKPSHSRYQCFEKIQRELKTKFTPDSLKYLLSSSESAWKKDRDYDGCQLSNLERQALSEGIPWRVFVVVARELANADSVQDAIQKIKTISGFEKLENILNDHFFQRGKLIRCYRILSRLLSVVEGNIQYKGLNVYRKKIRQDREQMNRFIGFICSHREPKSEVADELRRFLSNHLQKNDYEQWEDKVENLVDHLKLALKRLEWINRKYSGLNMIQEFEKKYPGDSSKNREEEIEELRVLFGFYPGRHPEANLRNERQNYWRSVSMQSHHQLWKAIATLAEQCYGHGNE